MLDRKGYDYFLPYYRDRALCLGLGVTPYEMLCQANGNVGDKASESKVSGVEMLSFPSDLLITGRSDC